jgi:hypothetical protein
MARFYHPFWVTITCVLCLVFAVLFLPTILDKYGVLKSVIFTGAGVIFIWITYFVRAWVFGQEKSQD